MKTFLFALALAFGTLAASPARAALPSAEAVEAQLAELASGLERQSCSGSIWCASWEHCVNGECKPKDAFNRCDAFNSCSLGEQCVDGVCQR